jgi:hypothetical protein
VSLPHRRVANQVAFDLKQQRTYQQRKSTLQTSSHSSRIGEADLCFAVYVHGDYDCYVPLYIASALISYPAAFVKVFVSDNAVPTSDHLDYISSHIGNRFSVLRWSPLPVPVSKFQRTARWLLPQAQFLDYRYVYIGDVDFVIVHETGGITQPHVDHCRDLGVPFSNVVRKGTRRLTGLHFVETSPYFEQMQPVLDKYATCTSFLSRPNEEVLYDLVQEGIGIPLKRMSRFPYRPHHGLHLGVLRGRSASRLVDSDYWRLGLSQFRQHRHFVELLELCRGADARIDRFYELFMA